jgi:hypothetical protein
MPLGRSPQPGRYAVTYALMTAGCVRGVAVGSGVGTSAGAVDVATGATVAVGATLTDHHVAVGAGA